MKSYLVAYPE